MSKTKTSPESLSSFPREMDFSEMSPEQLLLLEALVGQETTRQSTPLKEMKFRTGNGEPAVFAALSDIHLGSHATDMKRVYELRDQILNTDNAYVYILGDAIEGIKQEYYATNVEMALSLDKQIKLFQDFIRPLYEAGRVICIVGEYFGHEGWAKDKSGVDIWQHMLGDMDIPIVRNNAQVLVEYGNRHKQKHQVMHDPGRKSIKDVLHGLRIVANREDSDVAFRGHLHTSGVGVENYGKERSRVLVAGGTFKGVNEELPPDKLGTRKAMSDPGPGGQVLVATPRTRNKERVMQPFADPREGLYMHAALELLEATERQGITEELIEELRSKHRPAKMKLVPQRSRRDAGESVLDKHKRRKAKRKVKRMDEEAVQQSNWFNESYVAPYDTLGLETSLSLPISIEPVANLRMGSPTFKKKDFEQYMTELENDSARFVVWLRKLIDPDVGKLPMRKEILDQLLANMKQVGDGNIALLLDSSLTSDDWKKPIMTGSGKNRRVASPPLAPGSFLAQESGVPLVNNMATVDLIAKVGGKRNRMPLVVLDHLVHRGSSAKPVFGLQSLYIDGLLGKPWVAMGGHMPHSGWNSFYDQSNPNTEYPIFMAPGNWSQYSDMGKANRMSGGKPGSSLILVPNGKQLMVVPVHSFDHREALMSAATLQVGLEKNGKRDTVMTQKGRSSRRRRRSKN